MPPARNWTPPLAPNPVLTNELLGDCYDAGLIAIHPESDITAFDWEPTFDEATETAGDDPAVLLEPMWSSFYPMRTSWYVPYGTSPGKASEILDRFLTDRLGPDGLDQSRIEQLLDLVVEVIAAETVRYFVFHLDRNNLPEVPENHMPRLIEAARRLAGERSLAEAYHLAWIAVRSAAATATAAPLAPKVRMTTYGVNVFETKAQKLAADPTAPYEPYREDSKVPLSALTRTLFLTVLNADMMSTTRADAGAILSAFSAVAPPTDIDHDVIRTMQEILASDLDGDPHQVYAALGAESGSADPVVVAAADHLVQIVERFRVVGYDLAGALAGAVNASQLLPTPVTVADIWSGGPAEVSRPVGAYLAELMFQAAERSRSA